jgi:hypothetical protein
MKRDSTFVILTLGLTLVLAPTAQTMGGGDSGDSHHQHKGHHGDAEAGEHHDEAGEHHLGMGAFGEALTHYETIRVALLHDKLDDVKENARSIGKLASELGADFSAEGAGVAANHSDDCRALLPEVRDGAHKLAEATEIGPAREAFYALSKPLVRYRQMASGERPVVVYCSMAQKSWLQPAGEIGNPYYGQKMARCGEIVSK